MKLTNISLLFTSVLLIASCKDEKAEARITELEDEVSSLEADKDALQADLDALRPMADAIPAEEGKALNDRITELEAEVQRLSEFQTKCDQLEKDLADAKTRLADATMVPGSKSDDAKPAEMTNAIQDKGGSVIPAVFNSVLIIEGDQSNGTGFMAKTNNKIYFYTAAHVLSGNSKLVVKSANGTKYSKFGPFEYAEGADLVRMEVLDNVEHYLEIVEVGKELPLQVEIAALGNGGGAGVVTMERGRILGVSGESLEVDAGVIQGNSGGPVVHLLSGKVVGLITHLTAEREDIWADGTRQGEVRRFACRLNKEWEWKPIKIGTFLGEARQITEYDRITRLCFAIAALEPMTTGLRLDTSVGGGGKTVLNIFDENKNVSVVQSIVKLNSELAAKKMNSSEYDLKKKFRSIIAEGVSMAQRNEAALKPAEMSWFHRKHITSSAEARKEAVGLMNTRIEDLK